jgi:predicted outer membrane repeat protein
MFRKIFLITLFILFVGSCQPGLLNTVNNPADKTNKPVTTVEKLSPYGMITSENSGSSSKNLTVTINYNQPESGFRTQAVDCDLISSVKVAVSGIYISTPIQAAGGDISTGAKCTFTAKVLAVPYGKARITTVEAYDSGNSIISGATIKAVFDVSASPVNAEISYRSTPNAKIIEALIGINAKKDLIASKINLGTLASKIDTITGFDPLKTFPDYTYTTHPSLVNTSAIATDLESNGGDASVLNTANAGYKITAANVTGTIAGLVDADTVDIRVDDPASSVLLDQGNGNFTVSNVTPGSWKVTFVVNGQISYNTVAPISTGALTTTFSAGTISYSPVNTPSITDISSATGTAGDIITITGTNFYPSSAGNVVKFGTTTASATYNSGDGTISATVPASGGAMSTGMQNITVSVGNKTSNAKDFSFNLIYVNDDAPGSVHDGSSWANAFTSLQSALTAASSGMEIWVAEGNYKPTTDADRTKTFQLKSGVKVYGGFAGTESLLTDRTASLTDFVTDLSGDIGTSGVNTDNSYHVVIGVTGATIEGVSVKYGYASDFDINVTANDVGGGMINNNSSPTITNVTFSNNSSFQGGGAMYNANHSDPTITNVTFSNNSADFGGGMVNGASSSPILTNVTFSNNSAATEGGGIFNAFSSIVLTNVTFSNNSAATEGGGMYNYKSSPTLNTVTFSNNSANSGGGLFNDYSPSILDDVTFSSNSATGNGGGIYNNGSSPTLADVTFIDNSASSGGGMSNVNSSPTLKDVTFSNNFTKQYGGGMHNDNVSNPTLNDCTFSGNKANFDGGGMYNKNSSSPALTNVTFSGNSGEFGGGMANYASSPTLTNVTFSGNSGIIGGGLDNRGNSSPIITNCTFTDNIVSLQGGGMFNENSSPTMTNVNFSGNSATSSAGGGMYNKDSTIIITNATFFGNSAAGAGAILNGNSTLTLTNVTVSGNSASSDNGGGIINSLSTITIKNSIIWGNTATLSGSNFYSGGSTINIGFSDVEGGFTGLSEGIPITYKDLNGNTISDISSFAAGFNINTDPLFLINDLTPGTGTFDLDGSDNIHRTADDGLELQAGSPVGVRDGGTSAGAPATDITGASRPIGGGISMGAYEK